MVLSWVLDCFIPLGVTGRVHIWVKAGSTPEWVTVYHRVLWVFAGLVPGSRVHWQGSGFSGIFPHEQNTFLVLSAPGLEHRTLCFSVPNTLNSHHWQLAILLLRKSYKRNVDSFAVIYSNVYLSGRITLPRNRIFDRSRLLQKNVKQVTWRSVAPSTDLKEFPFLLIQRQFHQELIHFISVHN